MFCSALLLGPMDLFLISNLSILSSAATNLLALHEYQRNMLFLTVFRLQTHLMLVFIVRGQWKRPVYDVRLVQTVTSTRQCQNIATSCVVVMAAVGRLLSFAEDDANQAGALVSACRCIHLSENIFALDFNLMNKSSFWFPFFWRCVCGGAD